MRFITLEHYAVFNVKYSVHPFYRCLYKNLVTQSVLINSLSAQNTEHDKKTCGVGLGYLGRAFSILRFKNVEQHKRNT